MKRRKDRKRETAWQAVLHEIPKDRFESIWTGLPEGVRKKSTAKDLAELMIFLHSQLEIAGNSAKVEMNARRAERLAERAARFVSDQVAMFKKWKGSLRIAEKPQLRLSAAAVGILSHVRSLRFGK